MNYCAAHSSSYVVATLRSTTSKVVAPPRPQQLAWASKSIEHLQGMHFQKAMPSTICCNDTTHTIHRGLRPSAIPALGRYSSELSLSAQLWPPAKPTSRAWRLFYDHWSDNLLDAKAKVTMPATPGKINVKRRR